MDRSLKASMEKKLTAKSMHKLLRLLPKAAQASVSFQNPKYSPARDKRPDPNSQKIKPYHGAGPIVSMIPAEAREKTEEPTSPKISCIGQIKHKNKICRGKKNPYLPKELKPVLYPQPEKISKARSVGPGVELRRKTGGIKKIFSGGRKSDASSDHMKPPTLDRAPSLSQMRKFATSRDTLANFDWRSGQIAPCYDEDSDGEDDVGVSFSAPILGGLVLEPRKEINLWKRRTMAQPKPLQLNMVKVQ